MGRVSKETIKKLNAFIESLPEEARSKCALCNETLTHIVKQAEAQTGAGTATVTKALSDKLNDGAAPGDRVSGEALQDRVRTAEQGRRPSKKEKMALCQNNQTKPPETQCKTSWAMDFAAVAISQLKRIEKNDPMRIEALNRVKVWVQKELNS